MKSLAAIFVAVCMVLIAASMGVALYAYFGIPGTEAALVGIATLTGLALYNAVTAWLRSRSDGSHQIAGLSRGTVELAGQVAALGREMTALEQRVETAASKMRATVSPLADEIGELGLLLKELADTVAAHDALLHGDGAVGDQFLMPLQQERANVSDASTAAVGDMPHQENRQASRQENREDDRIAEGAFAGMTQTEAVAAVVEAVEASRIDLLLQPVVTLPQRKVRYYEAFARMRRPDGETAPAVEFLPFAEAGGVAGKLDTLILLRCIHVLRRLQTNSRELGLFCNISSATLRDTKAFAQISDSLTTDRALAPSLILEFQQDAFNALGPIETDALAALTEHGVRFSLDHVSDLRFDPKALIARGVRHVKVMEAVLFDPANAASSDIHTSDLPDLLGRFGIDLIIERIEGEASVANLLDLDVRFGQGFLFAPPRAVRAEANPVEEAVAAPLAAPPAAAASSRQPDPARSRKLKAIG
ncbi:MAG TPA: EAL domain-containing protein [Xanthobacteraceae bacterium]|jgi:cyclic-di-GMP phosphodiesterase TipF (flagellum assembly factor)|nr:EAL domain-containing protein [Xanthobacteraceae bacterium]